MLEMSYMHCMQLLIFSRRGVGGGGGGGDSEFKVTSQGLDIHMHDIIHKMF